MGVFIITLTIFLLYLLIELYFYSKLVNRIHLRITVSGTRGKTTIVRMLASVCREGGMKVLAKTTGSEARYILPDGNEEKVKRRGVTSVIEQKRLIKKAVQLGVDCVITEIMSINPENHNTETYKLIKPGLTILSNLRADHLDVVENNAAEISALYLNDVYPGSKVFIPSEEIDDILRSGIKKAGAELVPVESNTATSMGIRPDLPGSMFMRNIDLVASLSSNLGIGGDVINDGLSKARMDIGDPVVYLVGKGEKRVYFVNSFAANDPVSAMKLVDEILGLTDIGDVPKYGFLSLRSDRGERSKQWMDFLTGENTSRFRHIFISGLHAAILTGKINKSSIIRSKNPEIITGKIMSEVEPGSIVFGLANIYGRGTQLVDYWKRSGMKI